MVKSAKDLGYLGEEYQIRLVKCLIEDQDFFKSIQHIMDQNMFTEATLRRIVCFMKDRYADCESVPTYMDLEVLIRSSIADGITMEQCLAMLKKMRNLPFEGIDLIENEAEKFFKQQNLVKAINKSTDIIKKGQASEYYVIEDIIRKALETNTKKDIGFRLFENIESDLKENYRQTIPTGCKELDESLYGGLGKGELGLIVAPMGTGKAMPLTTKIITPNGYKLMGDIKIGDLVIGRDGEAHEVIGVYPQGVRPIYKVSFSDNTSCECDIEHLWTVKCDDKNSYETITLQEILDKDYKKHKFILPQYDNISFNKQDITVDPYLLGFYIGIGSYRKDWMLMDSVRGANLSEKVQLNLHDKNKCGYGRIQLNCDDETNIHSILNDDAWRIPDNYLFNTKEIRLKVLKGFIDAWSDYDEKEKHIVPAFDKEICTDIKFIAKSLGYRTYIFDRNNEEYEGMGAVCDFWLEKRPISKYITNIEYLREDEAQCIMVNSDEHLYMVENFIVTHNTSVTTGFAAAAATSKVESNNYNGFKVLHFFFEDDEVSIRRKYYGYMLDIDACTLSDPNIRPEAIRRLQEDSEIKRMLKSNIISKRLSTGEVTASEIKGMIKQYISIGFKPDLVIIDYFECLKAERNENIGDSEWSKEGVTMRKLESICNDMKLAIWVPVQGTKGSIGIDTVTLAHAGGSVRKTQIGHIVLTLAQTDEQKNQGRLNLFIGKLRAAKIGRTQFRDVAFNNGTCKFDMSDLDNVDRVLDNSGISNSAQNIARAVKLEYRKKINF